MKRKNLATLFSVVFMGAGQLYNGEWIKGILFSIINIIFYINIFNGTIYHSLWGLITLGEVPGVKGDHSINLMIIGIISVMFLTIFLIIYIYNIKDAYKKACEIESGLKVETQLEYLKRSANEKFPYLVLMPAIILVLSFTVLPIIFTVLTAFTNYSSPYHIPPANLVEWVGFSNFSKLYSLTAWKTTILHITLWTIVFAFLVTIVNYFAGLVIALLLNSKKTIGRKFWRVLYFIPYAIPVFISLLVFRLIFSGAGPINSLLFNLELITDRVPFLSDGFIAKITIVMVSVWLGAPYWMALMSGTITNIDSSIYESASIDGASKWQQFWHITIPMVLFQTAPLLIMTFAFNFNNFNQIYLLTMGDPANAKYKYAGSTDILISWIYKMTLDKNQYGMASAVTIILFIFVAGISVYSFTKTKSFNEEDIV